jgi:hypothetical protein
MLSLRFGSVPGVFVTFSSPPTAVTWLTRTSANTECGQRQCQTCTPFISLRLVRLHRSLRPTPFRYPSRSPCPGPRLILLTFWPARSFDQGPDLCGRCAAQAAWGHQLGFSRIDPPCGVWEPLVDTFPVDKPGGWRSYSPRRGSVSGPAAALGEESDNGAGAWHQKSLVG